MPFVSILPRAMSAVGSMGTYSSCAMSIFICRRASTSAWPNRLHVASARPSATRSSSLICVRSASRSMPASLKRSEMPGSVKPHSPSHVETSVTTYEPCLVSCRRDDALRITSDGAGSEPMPSADAADAPPPHARAHAHTPAAAAAAAAAAAGQLTRILDPTHRS
eukprot:CAMPEP_0115868758 /NCGR_PEP_ID=MMETSP0287-20121206/21458_1 /TAXON_ID=412157 /ORGANISM="Chrysochromulina rotalis, Strain UIO044" /LENGTH=164 /DNA_ID=CAMNT_0003323423 /DNA_START=24 /DNA_END=519 /DNA_ORIENTATION=+